MVRHVSSVSLSRIFRRVARLLFIIVLTLGWFSGGVRANPLDTVEVTAPTDFWFTVSEPTSFSARTFMIEGFQSDPQLWLYDSEGTLITENDDSDGLQSFIAAVIENGNYRVRAATCCGDPDGWRAGGDWNIKYLIGFSQTPEGTPTGTTSTTEAETTTSTSEASTSTSTNVDTVPTTTVETTVPEGESTTTWVESTNPTTTSSTIAITTIAPVTATTLTSETSTIPTPSTTSETQPPSSVSLTAPSAGTTVPETTSTADGPTTTVEPIAETTTSTTPETESTIPVDLDPDELVSLIGDLPLQDLSPEDVTALVENIVAADLTDEQAEQIAEALSDAPDDVKAAFETAINVFGGQFDSYVPKGSNVSVGERRIIVAATAALSAMTGVPTVEAKPRRKQD